MRVENHFRENNCPNYGAAYCDCPFVPDECAGALTCGDLIIKTD
jgi:hypothetical protein